MTWIGTQTEIKPASHSHELTEGSLDMSEGKVVGFGVCRRCVGDREFCRGGNQRSPRGPTHLGVIVVLQPTGVINPRAVRTRLLSVDTHPYFSQLFFAASRSQLTVCVHDLHRRRYQTVPLRLLRASQPDSNRFSALKSTATVESLGRRTSRTGHSVSTDDDFPKLTQSRSFPCEPGT